MAGRRMKLSMDMNVFSASPVDRKVLINWESAIGDMYLLRESLRREVRTFSPQRIDICYMDSRLVTSIIEANDEIDDGIPTKIDARRDAIKIAGNRLIDFFELKVADAAQPEVDFGLWYMMVLNTHRAMVQKKSGPMSGINFNITMAGIVATCLRLGVAVDFEAA